MNSLCENEELLFWHLGSRSFTCGGIFLAEIVLSIFTEAAINSFGEKYSQGLCGPDSGH